MKMKSIIRNVINGKYVKEIEDGGTPYYELTNDIEEATVFDSRNYGDRIRLKEAYLSEDYELLPINDQIFF